MSSRLLRTGVGCAGAFAIAAAATFSGCTGGAGGAPATSSGAPQGDGSPSTSSGGPVGSGEGGVPANATPASGPEAQDFVARFCALFTPCCSKYGFGPDEAKCRKTFGTQGNLLYSPNQGEDCIAGMTDGIAKDPDWCRGPFTPQSCALAFFEATAGPPGSNCTSAKDCLPQPDGPINCVYGSSIHACQVTVTGTEGEPCLESDDTHVNSLPDPPVARLVSCKTADNLYCDEHTHVCTKKKSDGSDCEFDFDCLESSYCDGFKCQPKLTLGQTCAPTVPRGQCIDGLYCPKATSKCAPYQDDGAPCSLSEECKNQCVDNKVCGTDGPMANIVYLLYCDHD